MKKVLITGMVVILFIFILFVLMRDQEKKESSYLTLSAEAVHRLLNGRNDVIIIDVRTFSEYSGPLGHIPDARLKPLQHIEDWVADIDSLKSKRIVLVCRSGNRSRTAAEFLAEKGFKNLINLQGGMLAWNQKGFEVER